MVEVDGSRASDSGQEEDEERCPACRPGRSLTGGGDVTWICCTKCETWYHCPCIKLQDPNSYDKWYCQTCVKEDGSLVSTRKPEPRKSERKKQAIDYRRLNSALPPVLTSHWEDLLSSRTFEPDHFPRKRGSEVTLEWLASDETAFRIPVLVPAMRGGKEDEGLGMSMPRRDLRVRDVARVVGEDTPLEVIDVANQSSLRPPWNLGQWADYFETPKEDRDKVLNVISLEVSDSELGREMRVPRIVDQLDWVTNHWPGAAKTGGRWPKVQKYCLMSTAQSYTDFHIDMAASSVFYTIRRGTKSFFFIEPTRANLLAYERWTSSSTQASVWLGDLCKVVRVDLKVGDTMFIPSGWIHAVYTAEDSLVFGGNFVHSYDIPLQLRIVEMERVTNVPQKHRFPYFTKLCWHVAHSLSSQLSSSTPPTLSERVLRGLLMLSNFLLTEVDALEADVEDNTPNLAARKKKRRAREALPAEWVKDPRATAEALADGARKGLERLGKATEKKKRKAEEELENEERVKYQQLNGQGRANENGKISTPVSTSSGQQRPKPLFRNFSPSRSSAALAMSPALAQSVETKSEEAEFGKVSDAGESLGEDGTMQTMSGSTPPSDAVPQPVPASESPASGLASGLHDGDETKGVVDGLGPEPTLVSPAHDADTTASSSAPDPASTPAPTAQVVGEA